MLDIHQEKLLSDIRDRNILLIVEGKKDKKALERMGLENIFEISGKRLENVSDNIKHTLVAILTDYDREGMKYYKRLKSLLIANEIAVNDDIRRKFRKVFFVNKIEELNSHFK